MCAWEGNPRHRHVKQQHPETNFARQTMATLEGHRCCTRQQIQMHVTVVIDGTVPVPYTIRLAGMGGGSAADRDYSWTLSGYSYTAATNSTTPTSLNFDWLPQLAVVRPSANGTFSAPESGTLVLPSQNAVYVPAEWQLGVAKPPITGRITPSPDTPPFQSLLLFFHLHPVMHA